MKGIIGIVIGFLIAYLLFKNGGFSIATPLGAFGATLGAANPNAEQIDGSTTTYSLDGNAQSGHNPFPLSGGCGCGH
jgi:hypothetical protein